MGSARTSMMVLLAIVGAWISILGYLEEVEASNGVYTEGSSERSLGGYDVGSIASEEFVVVNDTEDVLCVERVWTSCGCTVASLSGAEIAPGGKLSVLCDLDTSVPGKRSSKVFLDVLGMLNPVRVGSVDFNVRGGWYSNVPEMIVGVEGGVVLDALPFLFLADEDIDMSSVVIGSACLGVEFDYEVLGRRLSVRPTVDDSFIGRGYYRSWGEIISDSINAPRFRFPIIVDYDRGFFRTEPPLLSTEVSRNGNCFDLSFSVIGGERVARVIGVESLDLIFDVVEWSFDNGSVSMSICHSEKLDETVELQISLATDVGRCVIPILVSPGGE